MEGVVQKAIVTVLETSDIHGNILPKYYGNNQIRECGLAKISTFVQKQRQEYKNLIVIDNGDLFQGTPLTYHHARIDKQKENPIIKVMNHIGYDGFVIGNHEYNYGKEFIENAKSESNFCWLAANIIDVNTNRCKYGLPYIIKTFDEGIRVAILGVTTHFVPYWENPNHIDDVDFEDAFLAAKKWVHHLKTVEQVDVVIVSYHGGFERDLYTGAVTERLSGENQAYQMCMEIEGIDLLLTGHQHRCIEDTKVNDVAVIQPGAHGYQVGKITISIEKSNGQWKVQDIQSKLVSVKEYIPDNEVITMIEPYENSTQAWLDQSIGKIVGDMTIKNPIEIRLKEHPYIEFVNQVQMLYTGVDISATSLFDDHCPGLKKNVTMRDIVSNYIYPNSLKVLRVTGKDIKEALELSAAYFETYNGKEVKVNSSQMQNKVRPYNYDMWEGIHYIINISQPIGDRVVTLEYQGKPIEFDKEYDVVLNNYRAGGGGDYFMFTDKPVLKEIQKDVSELIAEYISEKGEVTAAVNENWKVILL